VNASAAGAESANTYAGLRPGYWPSGTSRASPCGTGSNYGPGTWYHPDGASDRAGAAGENSRSVGEWIGGVWSWVHIDDAALDKPPDTARMFNHGVYHVVDDDPSRCRVWLPAFAGRFGAPPPPRMTVEEALAASGEDAVYYGTKLRGASNARRSGCSGFRPYGCSG